MELYFKSLKMRASEKIYVKKCMGRTEYNFKLHKKKHLLCVRI